MEFLGVGPMELLFVFLIALIILGPKDMVKAGRTMGQFLRKVVKSPAWTSVKQASRDVRYLPNKLMRDAGLEEEIKDLQQINREVRELQNIRNPLNLGEIEKEINKPLESISTQLMTSADFDQPSTVPLDREVEQTGDDQDSKIPSHLSDNSQM